MCMFLDLPCANGLFCSYWNISDRFWWNTGISRCRCFSKLLFECYLSGRHYNRYNRIHVLLYLALQMLHFKRFMSEYGPPPPHFIKQLKILYDEPLLLVWSLRWDDTKIQWISRNITLLLSWSNCQILNHLHWFNPVTSDVQLSKTYKWSWSIHILCPRHVLPVFATNHPNYARYMVRYLLNLLNIEQSHPGIREMLLSGALSVRRVNKSFPRTPVDLTLEQTVDVDAASRMTGRPISAFTKKINARQRWTITHSARSAILGWF